jgi:alkanesulfonate monooxygenase SsuD/methylene tetrahydromethanopterin reductase-like flavin-dependent oxidoreductase (luciferase family)
MTTPMRLRKPVQQPHPPVAIGGGGEQLILRMVAHYADIWDCMTDSSEEDQHKSAVLDNHCATIGRDPATIERSKHVFVDPTDLKASRNPSDPTRVSSLPGGHRAAPGSVGLAVALTRRAFRAAGRRLPRQRSRPPDRRSLVRDHQDG